MLKRTTAVVALLALPAAASAQDFGAGWLDRVTHLVQQERGPQNPSPLTWSAYAGTSYYFDNNLFLTEKDEEKSSVIIPFLRGRLDYTAPLYDVQADLMVNQKFYTTDHDLDDNEERAFLHLRQIGSRYTLEVSELFQHLSDPTDSVFYNRVERVVSTTVPSFSFDMTNSLAIEGSASFQIVRFEDNDVDQFLDSNVSRIDGTLVWRTWTDIDLLAQVGYQTISYVKGQDAGAPPDAFGYYARLGFRGELFPALQVEVLAGYTSIESDYYRGTRIDEEDDDLDAAISFSYEITETLLVRAGYSRLYTFAGGVDSWQIFNRATLAAEWTAMEGLVFRMRAQFDRSDTVQGIDREFWSGSLEGSWKPLEWLAIDSGVTVRTGETIFDDETDTDFSNVIFNLGVVLIY